MGAGYVYILINPSMPGLIKIGRTKRDAKERARELSTSGVPSPFQVAFEVFADDCNSLERAVQRALGEFRVSNNREFYRYPLARAIDLVQEFRDPAVDPDSIYAAEEILHRLREILPGQLREELASVRIAQTMNRVWLEMTEEQHGYILNKEHVLRHQLIRRLDLGNLFALGLAPKTAHSNQPIFSADFKITENVTRFLAMGNIGFAELAYMGEFPADHLLLTREALHKLQKDNPEWNGPLSSL